MILGIVLGKISEIWKENWYMQIRDVSKRCTISSYQYQLMPEALSVPAMAQLCRLYFMSLVIVFGYSKIQPLFDRK